MVFLTSTLCARIAKHTNEFFGLAQVTSGSQQLSLSWARILSKFAWIGINCLLKLDSMDPTASGNAVGCIWWLPTCTAVQGTAIGSPWDTIYASCSTSGGCEGAHSFFCPLVCSLFIIRKTRDARKLDTKDLWDARVEGQARELNYNTWYDPYSTIDHVRDGFKKSKWKFKMAFAMKGGEGSRVPHTYFEKWFLLKTI